MAPRGRPQQGSDVHAVVVETARSKVFTRRHHTTKIATMTPKEGCDTLMCRHRLHRNDALSSGKSSHTLDISKRPMASSLGSRMRSARSQYATPSTL
jgi:hypothetical protein